MNAIFKGVAYTLAGIGKTILSRRIIEYMVFQFLEWMVKRTDNKYDDRLLELIKKEYYSEDVK